MAILGKRCFSCDMDIILVNFMGALFFIYFQNIGEFYFVPDVSDFTFGDKSQICSECL